eukprot:2936626-Amphidinium_carterae.2
MPDEQDERAWLAGSNEVRVVEVGWTPFACAILGTLYKPPAGHLPTIWEMAWDLAMCGIGYKAAFDGVYQHPSSWVLDTAYSILACEAGIMSAGSKGGYCPNEAAELWDWPPG